MSGQVLILYVLVPSIIIITLLFVGASVVLMRNNISATKEVGEKQNEIYDINVNINSTVTNIEDVISNHIVPSIKYIQTGVEELTFKPSIELITGILEGIGVDEPQLITKEGSSVAFGAGFEDNDFHVRFIVHYIESIEMILFTSISKQLATPSLPNSALLYFMDLNSQMLIGNIFIEDIKDVYPIVCNYSFKANKSNLDGEFFDDIIKRLSTSHLEVFRALESLDLSPKDLEFNDYLKLQNEKKANK